MKVQRFILLSWLVIFVCQCGDVPSSGNVEGIAVDETAVNSEKKNRFPDLGYYVKPNQEFKIFDESKLHLSSELNLEVINALVAIAAGEKTKIEVRTKALGVALRLDPKNKQAYIANEKLAKGQLPEIISETKGDKKTLADRIWKLSVKIKQLEGGLADDTILATYLMSIYVEMLPEDMDRSYEFAMFSKDKNSHLEWDTVLYGSRPVYYKNKNLINGSKEGSPKKLAKLQAKVKGLLVQSLGANTFAGKASQMNATAESNQSSEKLRIRFDQLVGTDMTTALDKVVRYLRLKHEPFPVGYDVLISFEEQYIPKDGPSAAVACALLINSLIEGDELDSDIAVTGDMNADGIVQPVGGITGKLRGAERRDCNVIVIPVSNSRVIRDLLITNGISGLTRIQIFSIENFGEAWKLAVKHDNRESAIKESIELFKEVQSVLNRSGGDKYLVNSHVRKRLEKCLELTPNHLSAKILLEASTRGIPKKLSLLGSMETIDRSAEPLIRALRQRKFSIEGSLASNEYADAAMALKRLRPKLDSRTLKCVDAVINYSILMRRLSSNRPKSSNGLQDLLNQIKAAGNKINQEYDTLYSRVDVKEETMR